MKLYFSPGSCGLGPQIALREAGQTFELIQVDFSTKQTVEGNYYHVTPKGFVPALKLENGDVITEVAIILQWIADNHPQSKLLPEFGSRERYTVLEWLNYIASDLHKGMAVMFSPLIDAKSKANFSEINLGERWRYIDEHLAHNTYLLGEQFSVADTYLYNVLCWPPRVGIDISCYKSIQKFMINMEKRPSVRAALEAEGLLVK
jgi:glutathione S-transferase